MTDVPPTPPGSPAAPTGGGFCGQCGAALDTRSAFCGECGAATAAGGSSAPATAAGAGAGAAATGASTWTGVQPVVERPTEATSPPPPPTGAAGVTTPGAGGPPPPMAPESTSRRGKGPIIAIAVLVIAALAGGAFFLLSGGDDDDDDVAADDTETTVEDEEDEEEDETTTTEAEDEDEETTTTAPEDDPLAGIDFVPLTDATGQLIVEVPSDWTDTSLALEGASFASIQASTDLAAFRTAFVVPGMSFSLLNQPPANFDQVLDFLAASANIPANCTTTGKDDYTDGVFTGRLEVWENCAEIGTTIVMIVAARDDGRTIEISTQLPEGEPLEIALHIAQTFNTVG